MKKSIFLYSLWILLVSGLCFGDPLLDPPTWNTWVHATVNAGTEIGNESEGTEGCSYDIEVLANRSTQILPGGLSRLDLDKYDSLAHQLKTAYEGLGDREKLRLSRDLYLITETSKRETVQVWIQIKPFIVHYVWVFDALTGNILMKVEDESSGVYFGRVDTQPDPEEMKRLVEEVIEDPSKAEEIREKLMVLSEQGTHEIVMNGIVIPVNADDSPINPDVDFESEEFWLQLPDDDSRKRLETAIYVLFMAMKDKNSFPMLQEKWITPSTDSVPIDSRLQGCGPSFTGVQMKTDVAGFDAPPDDVLKDFFGEKGLPVPDPYVSFKKLVRSTL